MRFAKNEEGRKIEVQYSGQRAICPCCNSEVVGRKGRIRPKHWYHKSTKDCDSWYEPITKWHLEWQNYFPIENQEVELIDKEQNVKHRADVRLNNGLVLEVQNSPIGIDEVEQRENFYSKNGGLIWILNGENLLKKCSINYTFEIKQHSISVQVPEYVDSVKYYSFDEIRDDLLECESVKEIKSRVDYKSFDTLNGSCLFFYFENGIDFFSVINKLKEDAYIATRKHYKQNVNEILSEFEFDYISIPNDRFVNIRLTKSYWRQFIDEMKSPVLMDNIEGMDKGHLYYYQKNQIIRKEEFISNLKYSTNPKYWL